MKVGGREFDGDRAGVEKAMKGIAPDSIQKFQVLVNGVAYPPKQVLEAYTGWPRSTFTTHEAQRVLARIGLPSSEAFFGSVQAVADSPDLEKRISALEAAVATAQEAILGLSTRVGALEA